MVERRQEEQKYAIQRLVTLILLLIFTGVTVASFVGADQAERSTVIQTTVNLLMLAVGYWFGKSTSSSSLPCSSGSGAKPPESSRSQSESESAPPN
jgi:uncharacterized membrane protein YwzB